MDHFGLFLPFCKVKMKLVTSNCFKTGAFQKKRKILKFENLVLVKNTLLIPKRNFENFESHAFYSHFCKPRETPEKCYFWLVFCANFPRNASYKVSHNTPDPKIYGESEKKALFPNFLIFSLLPVGQRK